MRVSRAKAVLALLASPLLFSCSAGTQWSKAGTDAATLVRDRDQCRRGAVVKAQEEYNLDRQSLSTSPIDERDSYRLRMLGFEAKKREQRLFERCMHERGYQKVEKKR